MKNTFWFILWPCICVFVGAYSHETDLVRQCEQQNTLHLWSSDSRVSCTIESERE